MLIFNKNLNYQHPGHGNIPLDIIPKVIVLLQYLYDNKITIRSSDIIGYNPRSQFTYFYSEDLDHTLTIDCFNDSVFKHYSLNSISLEGEIEEILDECVGFSNSLTIEAVNEIFQLDGVINELLQHKNKLRIYKTCKPIIENSLKTYISDKTREVLATLEKDLQKNNLL